MTAPTQLGLFARNRPSIEQRFAAFHAANPHVFAALEREALTLVAAGARRIGVKALWENCRGRMASSESRPAMDNSYTALYARLLIERHPVLASVIELRTRKNGRAA